jgi:hypothetical protein
MRLFFLFLIFIFHLQIVNAQKFSLGPRLGFNLSQIRGMNYSLPRSGWDVGVLAVYKPCVHTGFSADLLFSSNGSRTKHSNVSGQVKESWDAYINMNYLRLPLLYNIYFGKDECLFRPKVFAGVSTGFLLSATQSLKYSKEDNLIIVDSSSDKNISNQFRKLDMGFVIGSGFTYKIADQVFFNLDVRYQYGIQDIRAGQSFNIPNTGPLYSNNMSVLFGIAYTLK